MPANVYRTGTVAVTNGSAAIALSGGLWGGAGVPIKAGDAIFILDSGFYRPAGTFNADVVSPFTSGTLDQNWIGSTTGATSYFILLHRAGADVFEQVRALIAAMAPFSASYSFAGNDKILTLDKVAAGNLAELLFRTGASDKFRLGTLGDNEFALQWWSGTAWIDLFRSAAGILNLNTTSLSRTQIGGEVTVSSVAFVAFAGFNSALYKSYELEIDELQLSTAADVLLQVSNDGGSSYITAGYTFQLATGTGTTLAVAGSDSDSGVRIAGSSIAGAGLGPTAHVRVRPTPVFQCFFDARYYHSSGARTLSWGSGILQATPTAIRVAPSAGILASGKMRFYGLK